MIRYLVALLILSPLCSSDVAEDSLDALSEVTPGGLCDPVGTKTLLEIKTHVKCVCRPGFHGFRCENIFRCVSGVAMNVSCDTPPAQFRSMAGLRCVKEQSLLEVCNCFAGYTGVLCTTVVRGPQVEPVEPLYPRIPTEHLNAKWKEERDMREKAIVDLLEENQEIAKKTDNDISNYRILLCAMAVITICSACLAYCYFIAVRIKYNRMSCSYCNNAGRAEQMANEDEDEEEVPTRRRQNRLCPCELPKNLVPPPSYSESARLAQESLPPAFCDIGCGRSAMPAAATEATVPVVVEDSLPTAPSVVILQMEPSVHRPCLHV